VELIAVDIVRENDGLAKSSRNVNLLPKERQEAPVLYHSLQAAVAAINEGERNPAKLISMISEMITNESTGTIDYVQIYSYPQLKQLEKLEGTIIIALAVKFTKVRLIDNYITNID
jgi:pantoate--beta-alanine ligase